MALTPIESIKGAKNKHPTTRCLCDCGKERVVRTTRLRLGLVSMCADCARAAASKRGGESRRRRTADERRASDAFSTYKQNAKKRGLSFELSLPLFSELTAGSCTYCGTSDRVGLDRVDSALGYSRENCVPCCADCNYAKRDMSKTAFLSLIARIYAHQSR